MSMIVLHVFSPPPPGGKKLTSSENKTPPIGDPKATATPAAAQAERISRILAALRRYFVKNLLMTFPVQTA